MRRPMAAAAILLFVFFLCGAMRSQDASPVKANCVPPRVTKQVNAVPSHYPKQDKATAIVDIMVDEKGRVRNPKIVTSSGTKAFDRDATDAVLMWRFHPSVCDGKPTPVHITVEMNSQVFH